MPAKKKASRKGRQYRKAFRHDYGYYRRFYSSHPDQAAKDSKWIGKRGLNEAAEAYLKDTRRKRSLKR